MTTGQIVFDRLAYVDRLTKTGMDDGVARAHADALDQAMRDGVATHADMTRLDNMFIGLDSRLTMIEGEVLLHRWLFGAMLALQLATLGALISLFVKLVK